MTVVFISTPLIVAAFFLFFLTVIAEDKIAKYISSFLVMFFVFISLFFTYAITSFKIGEPITVDDSKLPYPFENKKVFQKYWRSDRGNEHLFSVIVLNSEKEKDTSTYVFSSKNDVPDLFIILENKFCSITEQQEIDFFKMHPPVKATPGPYGRP